MKTTNSTAYIASNLVAPLHSLPSTTRCLICQQDETPTQKHICVVRDCAARVMRNSEVAPSLRKAPCATRDQDVEVDGTVMLGRGSADLEEIDV
ncbi:MAG: hypothetical protein EOO38_13395, partial [Cytophagaceae bacterium]